MTDQYERPVLSAAEQKRVGQAAARINAQPQSFRFVYLMALIGENARLTAECNQHRAALGIEPLPTYDPLKR